MRSSRREVAELNASSLELPELPPSWTVCKLGDVASLQPGYAFKSSWFEPKGVRLLRGINIEPNRVRWEDVVCVASERAIEFDAYDLQATDVVIAMDRPIISSGLKVAMLSEQDVPSLLLQRVGRFRVNQPLERGYLFRFLNSDTFVAHIGGQATGTQLPHISGTDIETTPFPLPPLAEQRRIVAKIETLTAKSRRAKEALDAIPALLERFRQSVLAAAFRGDLTADWREKNPDVEPAEELLKRIRAERRRRWEEAELAKMRAKGKAPGDDRWKDKYEDPAPVDASELPELPDGWVWTTIGHISHVAGGLTKHDTKRAEGTEAPLVSVAAVGLRTINQNEIGSIRLLPEDGDKGELKQGDLLVVEGNGSLSHIGRVALWDVDVPRARHQNHLIRVRPTMLAPEYVLEWLASPMGRDSIVRSATSATGLYTLSISKIERLPIPIPPLHEQGLIVKDLQHANERLRRIVPSLDRLSQQLADLGRSILAKAFRGELVPQDPNDEPASVLLERLRAEREQNGQPTNGAGRRRTAASSPPAPSSPADRGRKPQASRRSQTQARSRG